MSEKSNTQDAAPTTRGWFAQRLQRAARKRRLYADRYRTLYERSTLAIFELDAEGRVSRANARFQSLLGCTPDAILTRRLHDLVHPDYRDAETEGAAELLLLSEATSQLLPFRHASGAVVWLLASNARLTEAGQGAGMLCVALDLTAHRRAEDARREALEAEARAVAERDEQLAERARELQRMETIGRLAGGVAHDFNNRLTVILGNANLIRFASSPDSSVARQVDVIERAALQAAQLTQQLLGFARRDRTQHRPMDLHRVIGEALALLNPGADGRIRLCQALEADRVWVQGEQKQLRQVVLNLITHAVEAMDQGGELHVATANVELDAAACQLRGGLTPGAYVLLRVRDTGVGISPDDLPNIFEPFFTPHRNGRTAGMGLAVVYNTVRNHGGAVDVASTVRQGATFTVYLPVCERPASVSVVPASPATRGVVRRVLVVDDEAGVRDVMVGILEKLGYGTVTAENGREAVDYYGAHAEAVDVVLVDLQMPVMDGRACCRELRRINPDVRILVMTGYAGGHSPSDMVVPGVRSYLHKPFGAEALAQELARVLV